MGVDTKLYLNSKWSLENIITVLERNFGEIKYQSCYDEKSKSHFGADMHHIFVKTRMITVFTNYNTPIGGMTLLSLSSDDEAINIFKKIAKVFGGLFMENDCDGNLDLIDGMLSPENGLPYFIQYAIMKDGIEPDNIKGLLKSMDDWFNRCTSCEKPKDLKDLLNKD